MIVVVGAPIRAGATEEQRRTGPARWAGLRTPTVPDSAHRAHPAYRAGPLGRPPDAQRP